MSNPVCQTTLAFHSIPGKLPLFDFGAAWLSHRKKKAPPQKGGASMNFSGYEKRKQTTVRAGSQLTGSALLGSSGTRTLYRCANFDT